MASVAAKSGSSNSSVPVSGAAGTIDPIPLVQVHHDPPHHHPRPAGHPALARPHDLVEPGRPGLRIGGAVDLAEQVPHRGARPCRAVRAAEALLHPARRRERARILEQHARGVGHGDRVVRGDLQQQVAVAVLGPEPVDREGGQRPEPRGGRGARARDEARAEPERHRQARRRHGQLRFGVRQRALTAREPDGIVGEQAHEPSQGIAVGVGAQIERDERHVRLRVGVDARLVRAVERHHDVAVQRRRDRGIRRSGRDGGVDADRGDGPRAGDGSPEEEPPPAEAAIARGGSIAGCHQ